MKLSSFELNCYETKPIKLPEHHYTSNKEIKNLDRWLHKWIRSVVCRNIRNIMRQDIYGYGKGCRTLL